MSPDQAICSFLLVFATEPCGERVQIATGETIEPDSDNGGEEDPQNLSSLQNYGMRIFPGITPGKASEIDRELGLLMNVTLMERDWTVYVTPNSQQAAFGAVFESAKATIETIVSCAGSGGFGCASSIAGLLKSLIDWGMEQTPPKQEVTDPDDYMGSDVWFIGRDEAQIRTSNTGGYGFWFNMPTTYDYTCLGFEPCPIANGTPATMRTRLDFCLYRDGIPDNKIKQVCAPLNQVIPNSAYSP